jgi:hypothetical protein
MRQQSKTDDRYGTPALEDWTFIDLKYGPLPPDATIEQRAERYYLVVSAMLIREYEEYKERSAATSNAEKAS